MPGVLHRENRWDEYISEFAASPKHAHTTALAIKTPRDPSMNSKEGLIVPNG